MTPKRLLSWWTTKRISCDSPNQDNSYCKRILLRYDGFGTFQAGLMTRSLRFSHNGREVAIALTFALGVLLLPGCGQRPENGAALESKTQGHETTAKIPSLGRQSKMPSLASSSSISPYLKAHQDDLVAWLPWGKDAFDLAEAENKAILLSIGFSACHWCHVMQRESFNDPATAKYMNDHFINVLVDREERPDIDAIYTRQLEALSVRVGWPMTLFLRPDGKAFYAGTYFPPGDVDAPHSFRKILAQINDMWLSDRRAVDAACTKVSDSISAQDKNAARSQTLTYANLNFALGRLLQRCDEEFGGLKQSRKFPVSAVNSLMMRLSVAPETQKAFSDLLPYCRAYVATTLNSMANGQINDHVGGGFFRYATTKHWRHPHFEKMLSDNALIAQNYFEAYSLTKNNRWRTKGVVTVEFMLDELALPSGLFAGSLDADSVATKDSAATKDSVKTGAVKEDSFIKEEGAFYTFNAQDIEQALPQDIRAAVVAACNFTAAGNCGAGKNLPYFDDSPRPASLTEGLKKLAHWRLRRPRPARNDTVVAAWNGMAISTLVDAYKATRNPKYLDAAQTTAKALLLKLSMPDKLAHSDLTSAEGFLDDYAYVEKAMLDLYSVDRDSRWRQKARELNGIVLERFLDKDNGKFLYASLSLTSLENAEHRNVRDVVYATTDGTWPGAAGTAIENLIRLDAVPRESGNVTSEADYLAIARRSLAASGRAMQEDPVAHASMLVALERLLRTSH